MTTDRETPGRRFPWGRVAVLGFAVVLIAPWFIGHSNTSSLENRAASAVPTITPRSLLSPSTYHGLDLALRDRVALRTAVINAIASSGYDRAGVSLSRRVYSGTDGWLFAADDFTNPCDAPIDEAKAAANLKAIASHAPGVPGALTVVIAPDKSTVLRDKLGRLGSSLMTCSDAQQARIERLTAAHPETMINLIPAVIALKESTGSDAYTKGDTHWLPSMGTSVGAALIPRLATDTKSPDVMWTDPQAVGTVTYGDLFSLLGVTEPTVTAPRLESQRGTTTFVDTAVSHGKPARTFTTTGVATIPGRTLFVYDSFLARRGFGNDYSAPQVAPYFASVTFVHWNDVRNYLQAKDRTFDRIVIDSVQRSDGLMFQWINEPQLRSDLGDALARAHAKR